MYGWADIVTIGTPVEAPYYVAVVPYFAAWLVALVGTMLATRWLPRRRTALRSSVLLIGPVVLYLSGILLGTDEAYLAGVRGVAFAVVALVWLAWRRGANVEASGEGAARLRRQKVTGTATVVAGAIAIGAVAGLALAPVSPDRFVLRDEIVPPFDPLEFPSPLSGYRNYTKDLAETPLFEVTGLEPGDVIRLATMDAYTGRLWNVAGPDDVGPDGGGYGIVGEHLPEPAARDARQRATRRGAGRRATTTCGSRPSATARPLSLLDRGTSDRAGDLRYNPAAGTAVLTSGLAEGARYELDAHAQVEPETDELLDTPVANLAMPAVENAPDVVSAKADEYVGEATTPIEQLRAIETGLKTNGFLSHGLASDTVPSRAGHGADRIIELFTRTQMVGDEEQYASAMALMARHLGYPARVVMGFAPEVREDAQAVEVVGGDVTAWVEVPFEGVGWVSFRPTPDQVDVPQEQTPKPKSEPQPQVRQPPRAEHDEEQLLTGVEIDDSDDDRDRPFVLPGWVWVAVAAVGIPAALVLLPMLVVALMKAIPPPPASQRRERPPRGGRVGGARRPLRRARASSRRRRARGCSPPAPSSGRSAEQGLAAPAVASRADRTRRGGAGAAVDPRGDHRPRRVRGRRRERRRRRGSMDGPRMPRPRPSRAPQAGCADS